MAKAEITVDEEGNPIIRVYTEQEVVSIYLLQETAAVYVVNEDRHYIAKLVGSLPDFLRHLDAARKEV